MNPAQEQPQAQTEEAPKKQSAVSATIDMMESIIDATARKHYEQAVTDRYMAQTYAKGAGISEEDARTIIALGRDYVGSGPLADSPVYARRSSTPVR